MKLTLLTKRMIHAAVLVKAQERVHQLQTQLYALQSNLGSETKSSAGDKHETGRARIQLEMERLGQQLKRVEQDLSAVQALHHTEELTRVGTGALVQLDDQLLYVSVALGQMSIVSHAFQTVGPTAPLIQALSGKQVGESAVFRDKTITVIDLV